MVATPAPRHHALFAVFSALLAGATAGQSLKVERRGDGFVAVFGEEPSRLELRGLRLVTLPELGLPQARFLPFKTLERAGSGWSLSTADPEHPATVQLKPASDGIRVAAGVRIGLRTGVLEATCEYAWAGADPPAWSRTPFLAPEDADVAPDVACPTPLAVLGGPRGGWALLPDAEQLAGERRLPWFLACRRRDGTDVIAHGRARYAVRGQRWFSLRGAKPAILTGEEILLTHTLVAIPGSDVDRTVGALARRQWAALATVPCTPGFEARATVRAALEAAIERAAQGLRPVPGHADLCFWLENPDDASAGSLTLAHDAERRPLALACAVAAVSTQAAAERRERVRSLVRLFLRAPPRGGLFPTRVRIDLRSGAIQYLPTPEGGFRTRDCAEVGWWLLRYADLDPELRPDCLERAQALAEFLRRNQHRDGSVPGRFADDLDALRDAHFQGSPDTLACGRLFLAMHTATGDSTWRAAAKACLFGVERALHLGTALEPEAAGIERPAGRRHLLARTAIDGAMLAHELLAAGDTDPATTTIADLWIDRLLPFQQAWSPRTLSRDLRGGVARAAHESVWSDQANAEAAHALLSAWRRTGERQLLERAAAALQAGSTIDAAGHSPLGEDRPWQPQRQGLAQAASSLLRALDTFGDVVVDLRGPSCVALECCDARLRAVGSDAVALDLEVNGDSPAMVRLRFSPPPAGPLQIEVAGRKAGTFPPDRLASGVVVEAKPRLRLGLRPPLVHDRRRDLLVRVDVGGARDTEALRGKAEIVVPSGTSTFPMHVQGVGGAVRLEALVPASTWEEATEIGLAVRVQEGDRAAVAPPSGAIPIELGEHSLADCGDDDERWLVSALGATIESFSDGAGRGQRLGPGSSLAYTLPIPATALEVELKLRVEGQIDLLAGSRLLARLATPPGHDFLDHVVRLRERVLWSTGELPLVVLPAPGGSLAWVRFRSEGRGSTAAEVGQAIEPPAAKETLRLRVLPVIVAEPPPASREALRAAFFDTASATSLASWVERVSRGRTRLVGVVEAWRVAPHSHQPPETAEQVALAARLIHGETLDPGSSDLVMVLHTGASTLLGVLPGTLPMAIAPCPTTLGEAETSDLAALLVQAQARPEAAGLPQEPGFPPSRRSWPALLGLDLHQLGWATLYQAALRDATGLVLPSVQEGGFLLALPGPDLPGRGRWLVERRSDLTAGVGILAYQELPPERPVLLVDADRPARRPLLMAAPTQMPLSTPHGEVVWQVVAPAVPAGPDAPVDLACGITDLLARDQVEITTALPGSTAVPLPIGGGVTAAGRVVRIARGLAITPVQRPKGTLRLVWSRTLMETGQRLSVRLSRQIGTGTRAEGNASHRLQIGTVTEAGAASTRWLLSTDLRTIDDAWDLVVTLPAQLGAGIALELQTLAPPTLASPTSDDLVLERLQACPLTPPFLELPEILARSRPDRAGSARLSDGWIYGPVMTLGEDRDASLDVPVSIPMGESRLRLQAGLPYGAPPGSVRRVSVAFREASGARLVTLLPPTPITAVPGPLQVFVVDLTPVQGKMGFLVIGTEAVGLPLALTIASIRRR